MVEISVGSVVFVRFPFSDLSGVKKRPALVLAKLPKNDLILCQITSKSYSDVNAVELVPSDFTEGKLIQISYIRPSKIFTANNVIVDSVVGKTHHAIHQMTINKIEQILRGNESPELQ